MDENEMSVYDFLTKQEYVIKFNHPTGGHGGGDQGIMRDFLSDIKRTDKRESISSASASLDSHLMAFAAEESRLKKGASDRKSTCLNSSHVAISYAVFCLKKKTNKRTPTYIKKHALRHDAQ